MSPRASGEPAGLLTSAEVARYLGVSVRTLERWRAQGQGPRWVRVYHSVRYRRADLAAWMTHQQQETHR